MNRIGLFLFLAVFTLPLRADAAQDALAHYTQQLEATLEQTDIDEKYYDLQFEELLDKAQEVVFDKRYFTFVQEEIDPNMTIGQIEQKRERIEHDAHKEVLRTFDAHLLLKEQGFSARRYAAFLRGDDDAEAQFDILHGRTRRSREKIQTELRLFDPWYKKLSYPVVALIATIAGVGLALRYSKKKSSS